MKHIILYSCVVLYLGVLFSAVRRDWKLRKANCYGPTRWRGFVPEVILALIWPVSFIVALVILAAYKAQNRGKA